MHAESFAVNLFAPSPPYRSGITTYSQELARALAASGTEIHFVNQGFWRMFPMLRVYSSRLAFAANKLVAIVASLFYRLPTRAHERIHHFQLGGGEYTYIILRHFDAVRGPRVVTVHEYPFHTRDVRNPRSEIEQLRIIRESDAVIVHTEELKHQLEFITRRLFLIPLGVDGSRFALDREHARRRLGLTEPVVSHIGFLFRYKGAEAFVKAAKDLPATLLIVGSGPATASIKQLADFLAPGKIRFVPYVRDEEYPAYIAASDIVVFPRTNTKGECSLVLVQAMAAGAAVVSYDVGCFREYLANGAGLLVEPGNISALRHALSRVLDNPELRRSLGARGQRVAREKLDWAVIAREHQRVYREVLSQFAVRTAV